MTNKVKYRDKLISLLRFGVDKNNEPFICHSDLCSECIFCNQYKLCDDVRKEWLSSDDKINWNNVAMDTPILIVEEDLIRYFCRYSSTDKTIVLFSGGKTSENATGRFKVHPELYTLEIMQ